MTTTSIPTLAPTLAPTLPSWSTGSTTPSALRGPASTSRTPSARHCARSSAFPAC